MREWMGEWRGGGMTKSDEKRRKKRKEQEVWRKREKKKRSGVRKKRKGRVGVRWEGTRVRKNNNNTTLEDKLCIDPWETFCNLFLYFLSTIESSAGFNTYIKYSPTEIQTRPKEPW